MANNGLSAVTQIEVDNSGLIKLNDKLRKQYAKHAVGKGNVSLAKVIRKAAPKDTGLLRKSIATKVKVYPSGVVAGIVGVKKYNQGDDKQLKKMQVSVNRVFRIVKGKRVRFKNAKPYTMKRNPTKYLHLVLLGTKKPDGGSRANNFIKRTVTATQKQTEKVVLADLSASLSKHT